MVHAQSGTRTDTPGAHATKQANATPNAQATKQANVTPNAQAKSKPNLITDFPCVMLHDPPFCPSCPFAQGAGQSAAQNSGEDPPHYWDCLCSPKRPEKEGGINDKR